MSLQIKLPKASKPLLDPFILMLLPLISPELFIEAKLLLMFNEFVFKLLVVIFVSDVKALQYIPASLKT